MGSGSSLLQSKPTRVLVMHNSYEGDMKSFMDDNKKAKSLQRAPSKGEEVARKLNLSSTKNFPINATQHFTVDPNGLDFNAVLLQIAKDMNEVLLFPITRQELDVTLLQIKILQNAGRVVSADRCSLFLIDQERQLLYAQVFHSVSPQSTGEFEVRHQVTVPLGKGIVGWVAKTGLTVNIEDAYKDQRFNPEVDRDTGYITKSILAMPITTASGETIGVAQLINKQNGTIFTQQDEKFFSSFLAYCGIALRNAMMYEEISLAKAKDEILLRCATEIFRSLDIQILCKQIMLYALELIVAERCSLFLCDYEKMILTSALFYEEDLSKGDKKVMLPMNKGVAGYVAVTGQALIINDPYNDPRFNTEVDQETGFITKSILCFPIRNSDKIVAVAQLVNKRAGAFTKADMALAKAFGVYCGIGLYNAQLYQELVKSEHKMKVALEVLSYHAMAKDEEVEQLERQAREVQKLPSAIIMPEMSSFEFDPNVPKDQMVQMLIGMFTDLKFIEVFNVPQRTLTRFFLSVIKNYRPVAYHNWKHAFAVCHTMYTIFKNTDISTYLSHFEMCSLLIACICHDLDHRGTNNSYQAKANTSLADLYGTAATLERHHFARAVTILQDKNHNIFPALGENGYKQMLQLIESNIIATDLNMYLQGRKKFQEILDKKEFNKDLPEHRLMLRNTLMTVCDVASVAKPWEVAKVAAIDCFEEFFQQGDEEKKLGFQPVRFMDRDKREEFPQWEIDFIDFICMPAFKLVDQLLKGFTPFHKSLQDNRERWIEAREAKTSFL